MKPKGNIQTMKA